MTYMQNENSIKVDRHLFLAGHLEGGRHVLPIRVYFEDTDFSGIVYHASYLRWCERGRSDLLRHIGIDNRSLADGNAEREPSAFAIRRVKAEYIKPLRIDDIIEFQTSVEEITKASLMLAQKIIHDGRTVFTLEVQCVLITLNGKIARMPKQLMTKIEALSMLAS